MKAVRREHWDVLIMGGTSPRAEKGRSGARPPIAVGEGGGMSSTLAPGAGPMPGKGKVGAPACGT